MSESILRLRVSSEEYDSKLKQATQNLTRYVDECRKVGGTLEVVEKETLDYVRALGQMDTTSRTATGKLAEMKKTFTELSAQYKQMTDEEKQSPFGKALAASLDQLKGRIQDSKSQLDDINKSINGGGGLTGALDNMLGKVGMNIEGLMKFGGAAGAATAALKVAGDAFFSNEQQLDDWGRTVESSKSLYTGFLDALNTSDISGYLQRIGQITAAARAAYNALDNLNTFNAFNQINVEKTRTGMTESIADYRSGQGSKETVRAAGAAYQKELRERQKLEREAYRRAVMEKAAERGVNGNDLLMALSGTYGSYQSLKAIPMSGRKLVNVGGGMFGGGTSYEAEFAANRQEKLGAALRRLNDTELQALQALGAQAERTGNEIAQVDKQLTRVLNGRQIGGGGITSGLAGATGGGFDVSKIAFKAGEGFKADPDRYFQSVWSMMNDKGMRDMLGIPGKQFDLGKDISEKDYRKLLGLRKDEDDNTKEIADRIGSVVSGVGNIFSGIQNLGVEIPDGLAKTIGAIQTMTGILTSILALVTLIKGEQTVQTTTGIIDAIVPFARGGVVRAANGYVSGNTYSGDQIPAMLNAGEVVLNRSQVSTLAAQFSGSGDRALNLRGVLRGSNILLCLENTLQEQGKGELVTFRG